MFQKYQHIERFGTDEVEGIEIGEAHVFPKIDGTNSVLWWDNGLRAGSRRRELTLEYDNAGFYAWAIERKNFHEYFKKYPDDVLYGEWLVPHTLKTYRENTWRNFYVFDVLRNGAYLHYGLYRARLAEFDISYIPAMAIVENGTQEKFLEFLDKNTFLIEDGKGVGEGIVIKNYGYRNKYGRQTWAKMVRNEFRDKHTADGKTNVIKYKSSVEIDIVGKYCTGAFVEKEYSKIVNDKGGWRSEYIPMLLGKVFHALIQEETWNFIKEHKHPSIDFKLLNLLVIKKIKETKPDLF